MFHTRILRRSPVATEALLKPRKRAAQQRSRATVAALVEATARILVTEGYEKASTNRIAEVAGVSIGSLYQYFPSKEALVRAVAERHNEEIMSAVGATLTEMEELPVAEAVRGLVAVAVEGHRVDPQLHYVLTEQIPRSGLLGSTGSAGSEAHMRFKAYLESRRDELRVRDVELAAFICATTVEAVTHNAVLHHAEMLSDAGAGALIEETVQMLLAYLTPPACATSSN
jgi:AcrR family transcriptional regulator